MQLITRKQGALIEAGRHAANIGLEGIAELLYRRAALLAVRQRRDNVVRAKSAYRVADTLVEMAYDRWASQRVITPRIQAKATAWNRLRYLIGGGW